MVGSVNLHSIRTMMISLELRQAARDLHRLQSKYEPITTSDTNTDGSSAEQTRYEYLNAKHSFFYCGTFFFSKLITRELQEWHQQQVSKYKTPSNDSSQANNERLASPISHIEDTDDMIASIFPLSSEDSRTICSSSFIMSDEPISLPTNIATFLPITSDNSNEQERSRFVDRENEHYSTSIFSHFLLRLFHFSLIEGVYMLDNQVWRAIEERMPKRDFCSLQGQ